MGKFVFPRTRKHALTHLLIRLVFQIQIVKEFGNEQKKRL